MFPNSLTRSEPVPENDEYTMLRYKVKENEKSLINVDIRIKEISAGQRCHP